MQIKIAGIKTLHTDDEINDKRMDILAKFKNELSELQANLLVEGNIRPPAQIAFNPQAKVLLWGGWFIGVNGAPVDPEEQFMTFLSDGVEFGNKE